MKATATITAVIFLFSSVTALGQQTYKCAVITKLGGKQQAVVTVNLNGDNDEMIQLSTVEKLKNQKVTSTNKLNVALIREFIINDTTYYFRDIKYDYNSKYHYNACVRLIEGNLDCGLFQVGNTTSPDKMAVKLPNDEYSKLVAVDFDYYRATLGWQLMAYSSCKSLADKMRNHTAGYSWNDSTPLIDRIAMWNNWIKEYNSCQR